MRHLLKLVFIISLSCHTGALSLSAQLPFTRPYEKLDTAKYCFEYNITENDSQLGDEVQKHFKLLIGDKYLRFCDTRRFQGDSIFSKPEAKKLSQKEGYALVRRYFSAADHDQFYINLQDSTYEFLSYAFEDIGYIDRIPQFEWELLDDEVNSYIYPEAKLKKAKTNFGGRTWYACYNPEIPLPYGPYFFGGLPGLIFSLWDEDKDFMVELSSGGDIEADNIQKSQIDIEMMPREEFYKFLWDDKKSPDRLERLRARGIIRTDAPLPKAQPLHYVPLIK